jgi:co-chaperonin GroES (HSP10)
MLQPIEDYFVVEVERLYEDTKTKSGIILLNAAWIDDGDMDRNEHKRIYGKVISVPKSFSDRAFRAVDEGMPSYRKFIGHDDIVDKINRGYRNHDHKSYYPSTFDAYDVVTYADIAKQVDVKEGDVIYFDPKITEPENKVGKNHYQLLPNDIFCVMRDWLTLADGDSIPVGQKQQEKQIAMQGEWVFVKPNMETWEEITTKSGIIMKPQPDKKWLEGVVAHTKHEHLRVGQRIVYLPNADCEIKVGEEKFYVMPVQDIIGELLN